MIFQTLWQLIKNLFMHGRFLPASSDQSASSAPQKKPERSARSIFVQLIGIISLNLAVVNLIPFPALDGGRFLMVIIEKIKGSAIAGKNGSMDQWPRLRIPALAHGSLDHPGRERIVLALDLILIRILFFAHKFL